MLLNVLSIFFYFSIKKAVFGVVLSLSSIFIKTIFKTVGRMVEVLPTVIIHSKHFLI